VFYLQIVSGHPHFIWIQLPNESVLWCPIDGQSRAAVKVIQFGREVVAKAIGKPERADWKLCEVDKEQESGMTETLKTAFRQFDPFSA
jgi:hypothetical protein